MERNSIICLLLFIIIGIILIRQDIIFEKFKKKKNLENIGYCETCDLNKHECTYCHNCGWCGEDRECKDGGPKGPTFSSCDNWSWGRGKGHWQKGRQHRQRGKLKKFHHNTRQSRKRNRPYQRGEWKKYFERGHEILKKNLYFDPLDLISISPNRNKSGSSKGKRKIEEKIHDAELSEREYDMLVRDTIRDNPPRKPGKRSEWATGVGIGDRVDVHQRV